MFELEIGKEIEELIEREPSPEPSTQPKPAQPFSHSPSPRVSPAAQARGPPFLSHALGPAPPASLRVGPAARTAHARSARCPAQPELPRALPATGPKASAPHALALHDQHSAAPLDPPASRPVPRSPLQPLTSRACWAEPSSPRPSRLRNGPRSLAAITAGLPSRA